VAFRFAFSYLALYLYPLSATLGWFWFFWFSWENHTYEWPWDRLVPWVGAHVLGVGHPIVASASGDSTYSYVKLLCLVLIAALAAAVWSVLDRQRTSYSRLHQWTRWYVRVVLAFTMIGYGTIKVIPIQMPPPSLITLMQPYGDLTPGRHLWTFMGIFPKYEIFCGLMETLAGVLLLIPGMTFLGAVVALGALVNVWTLSAFYDIPVKLGVGHLVLLASFLLLPDIPRVINLFVLKRRVEPERQQPLFRPRWLNYAVWAGQWAVALSLIVTTLSTGRRTRRETDDTPVTNPVYGIWLVDEFTLDGQVHPPLLTDSLRWQRVIFDAEQLMRQHTIASIQTMSGQYSPYVAVPDPRKGTLWLKSPLEAAMSAPERQLVLQRRPVDPAVNAELSYHRPAADTMILEGLIKGHQILVRLKKEDRPFALMTRGFHWIIEDNEVAY
jgi:hypothetical protein